MIISLTWLSTLVLFYNLCLVTSLQNSTSENCTVVPGHFHFELLHWEPWDVAVLKDGALIHYNISLCHPLEANLTKSAVSEIVNGQVKVLALHDVVKLHELDSGLGSWLLLVGPLCINATTPYSVIFHFECGPTLGSPQYTFENHCETFFHWKTSAACKELPPRREVPCYVYDKDGLKRDLSPLIKENGGYFVTSGNPAVEFFINVCSDILPDKDTENCPKGSAACRKIGSEHLSFGNPNTPLRLVGDNLVLKYNMTNGTIPANCNTLPETLITFKCPQRGKAKSPRLLSDANCHYDIEWETEHACPEDILIGDLNQCRFTKKEHGVEIDLSPLKKKEGFYNISGNINGKKFDFFMNVCGGLGNNVSCNGTSWKVNAACALDTEKKNSYIIGTKKDWVLRFADGRITLLYPGHSFCNGTEAFLSTLINFECDENAVDSGIGRPEFVSLEKCTYYFNWKTKHACINHGLVSRCYAKFGPIHVDLGDLAVQKGAPWVALDKHVKHNDSQDVQYLLNVCLELPKGEKTDGCDPESTVCKIVNGHAVSLGKYTSPPTFQLETRHVQLVYEGGSECKTGQHRKSIITFICKPGHFNTAPFLVRVSEDDCIYEFEWHTAKACTEGRVKGSNCQIVDDFLGVRVNLNPLRQEKYYKITTDSYSFYLNVCGKVSGTPCDQHEGKTQNAAACQVENKGDMKGANFWKLGEPNAELIYVDGMINLTYTGGTPYNDASHTPRLTTIAFICDPRKGRGSPYFVEEINNAYIFHWYTSFACSETMLYECVATDPESHKQYDLSRLTKLDKNWEVTNIMENNKKFYLNVCHRLNPIPESCSSQAAICSVDVKNGKEVVSVSNLGQPLIGPEVTSEGHLQLWYKSGDPCVRYGEDVNYTTVIHFLCIQDEEEEGIRYLGVVGSCEYSFVWMTKAACPIETLQSTESCSISHPGSGFTFDLAPLKKPSGYIVKTGSETFQLNICGGMTQGACQLPKGSQESRRVTVCTLDKNGTAQSILGFEDNSILTLSEDGYISLIYEGKQTSGGHIPKVIIMFECKNDSSDAAPQFLKKDGNEYYFHFKTPLVCHPEPYSCTFIDQKGRQYDLSSLSQYNWKITDVRPAYQNMMYHISFCRPLKNVNEYNCPGGAIGACQTSIKDPAKEGFSLGYLSETPVVSDSGTITIHYRGGAVCHKEFQRSTRINLYCSEVQKPPVFIGETPECEYIFAFQTPAACPLKSIEGENCTVTDPFYGYQFDLSYLHKTSGNYNVTYGEYSYLLNVCGKLNDPPAPCKASASCQIKPSDAEFAVSAGLSSGNLVYKDGIIQLIYESGKGNCHKKYNRSTVITFICDHHATDINQGPSFISEAEDCTYMFEWQTVYACPPFEAQDCTAVDREGNYYDLSALSLSHNNYAVTSPYYPGKTFIINVCRSVVPKPDTHCPYSSSVCLLDTSETDPTKQTKSLGKLGSGLHFENGKLKLSYELGDVCVESSTQKNMDTIITFECDSEEVDSTPGFIGKDGCTYYFMWSTSAACPVLDISSESNSTYGIGNCMAVNPLTGFQFDFSILKKVEPYKVYTTQNHLFLLNVCDDVKNTSCGNGVGICQEEVSGQRKWSGGKSNTQLHYHNGLLFLNYTSGDYCHQQQYQRNTIIQFVCDPERTGLGYPEFLYESEECTYYFEWITDVACEKKIHCAVRNGSDIYDLSSLISKSSNYIALSTMDSSAVYYLSICHQLNPISGASCPLDAAACRADFSHNNFTSLGTILMPPFVDFEDHVSIIYTNGSRCISNPSDFNKARVIFICDPSIAQGEPVLINFDSVHCVYVFKWSTSLVCPKEVISVPSHTSCSFSDDITGLKFDLSSLRKNNSAYKVVGDSTEYLLNICGAISSLKSGVCASAAVCSNASHGQVSYGVAESASFSYDGKRLWLRYKGGSECSLSEDKKRSTEIIFSCDPFIGIGAPTLHMKTVCSVVFIWHTSLVCTPRPKECALVVNRYDHYPILDLHPLSSLTHSWSANDSEGNTYWINVCRGIVKTPNSVTCPHSSAICKVDKNGKATSLGLAETQYFNATGPGIVLSYSHGDSEACSSIQSSARKDLAATTQITFTCGKTFGKPKFISGPDKNCVFNLKWTTNVACPFEESDMVTLDKDGKLHDLRLNWTLDISVLLNKTFKVHSYGEYVYIINLNHGMKNVTVGDACANAAVCQTKPSSSFYRDIGSLSTLRPLLKGSELQLVLVSLGKPCGKKSGRNVTTIINLQCSSSAGLGEPEFLFESSDCKYMFNWDTSVLCFTQRPSEHGSIYSNVVSDDTKPATSHANTSNIVVAVIFSLLLICVILFFISKRERRENVARKVKGAFSKIHIPRFRYRRVNGESLLLSDGGTAACYHDDGSDVDIIT